MSFIIKPQDLEEMKKLAVLVRVMNSQGHNPATSGNYSLRSQINPEIAFVSESGIDKSNFTADFAIIKHLELLKGFKGIKTHELEIHIPIFDNTQDIRNLAEEIKPAILSQPNSYGLLLRGHGIYVWGESVEEAKRHLEVFEYIFKYYLNSAKKA